MSMRRLRHRPVIALGVIVSVAILALAACSGGSGDRDKLVLALDWFPNADHAGIYVAQAQGFFEDEGLDIELQIPGNPENPPKFVAAGQVDVAISYEPDVILAKAQGLPITAVGSIVPVPLNSIQVLKSSGITGPADLAGKTIGFPGIPANLAYLEAIWKHVGVDGSTVKMVDVGFDLSPAMRGERVDATIGAYWNVEAVLAELEGFPVDVFHLEDFGVPLYDELVFIVSEDSVRDKGDLITRFLRAVARGHQYAIDHPEEAVDAVLAANPTERRDLIEGGVRLLVPIWAAAETFGQMDEARWAKFVDFLYDNDLIDNRPDLDKLLTNEFISE